MKNCLFVGSFNPITKSHLNISMDLLNKKIVDYADKVVVFWDGKSRGTLSVIKYAKKVGKQCEVILFG